MRVSVYQFSCFEYSETDVKNFTEEECENLALNDKGNVQAFLDWDLDALLSSDQLDTRECYFHCFFNNKA